MPSYPLMNDFSNLRELHKELTELIKESETNSRLKNILDMPIISNMNSGSRINNFIISPYGLIPKEK